MNRHAAFEDIDEAGFGALAGAGANALGQTKTMIGPEGITTKCLCEHCGTSNAITVEWLEAIYGSLEFVPRDWRVTPVNGVKYLYPHVGCSHGGCRREIQLGFTPAELKGLVARGIQSGDINPQWVQSQVAAIQQQVAGLGRR